MSAQFIAAPGWHPCPSGNHALLRYWDGQRWTGHTAAVGVPVVASDKRLEHAMIPTDRSALAVVAGYLGLFAFVVIPAPIALIVSIVALVDLNRRPHLLGRGRAWFGLAVGAIGTVVLLVSALTS